MKRPWLILIGGLVLALLAYGGTYLAGSAKSCCLMKSETPELAWLQTEFHLSGAELTRIQTLHESYQTACAERCRAIDAKNEELRQLLFATNRMAPEIEGALRESAQLRADCQRAMLEHFYEVSRTMPPAQGKRYFDWVIGRTLGSEHDSMTHVPSAAHEHQ